MTAARETKAITRIQIEGFRSLKSIDFVPGRITVLIGANGAGKSNLLSALRMVPYMRTRSLRRFVGAAGGASSLLHYGPKTTGMISIRLQFTEGDRAHAYSATLGYAADDALIYYDESVEYRPASSTEFIVASLGEGHSESRLEEEARNPVNSIAKVVRESVLRMNFFHFHDTSSAAPLRQNARLAEDQYLRSDGSNLAAFLYRLATSDVPEDVAAWRRINMLLRQVAPFVKQLEPSLVEPENPERSAARLRWTDEHDHTFGAHEFSDGTLRALALISALSQPASRLPFFVSIDEPELGLHPAAITLLVGLIRSVAPRCQVLLATQSPALLDHFEPDEVVVVEREAGESSLRRLEVDTLASWLEDYSLSELYDKNVLGGRP